MPDGVSTAEVRFEESTALVKHRGTYAIRGVPKNPSEPQMAYVQMKKMMKLLDLLHDHYTEKHSGSSIEQSDKLCESFRVTYDHIQFGGTSSTS